MDFVHNFVAVAGSKMVAAASKMVSAASKMVSVESKVVAVESKVVAAEDKIVAVQTNYHSVAVDNPCTYCTSKSMAVRCSCYHFHNRG